MFTPESVLETSTKSHFWS